VASFRSNGWWFHAVASYRSNGWWFHEETSFVDSEGGALMKWLLSLNGVMSP
jgi:hypothetical protein